jgi:hypothetical protein
MRVWRASHPCQVPSGPKGRPAIAQGAQPWVAGRVSLHFVSRMTKPQRGALSISIGDRR